MFNTISLTFEAPSAIALLGKNGSGKSTLLQLIAGYLMPSKGKVVYSLNNKNIESDLQFQFISFCAPYLELIEEMTLTEFLKFHFTFKKPLLPIEKIIEYIGLEKAKDKLISHFSSGMKQRVKLAQAIFTNAPILLLDEPCTNLDEEGIALYKKMMNEFSNDKIVIVASNDVNEYDICKTHIHMSNLVKK